MTSLKQASFPFKTGKNYPFHKVDFDYNFSKIRKVINLETYLFLAVDQQFNLHFIQYRDPLPHENPIIPPSFALKGIGNIKFSLEYPTLKAFLCGTSPEQIDFSSYFYERGYSTYASYDTWPSIFYVRQDRLLIKLSSEEEAAIIYYDQRLESEKTIHFNWPKTRTFITPVDTYRAILYHRDEKTAVLTCSLSKKAKILNFTHPCCIDYIKVLTKHGIAISAANRAVEILDMAKNKVIEKTILFDSIMKPKIIVDEAEHSGNFLVYFIKKSEAILMFWRIFPNRRIQKSEEINLPYPTNPDVIEFLNKDHIVIINAKHELAVYRLDERRIVKIHQAVMGLDSECVPKEKSFKGKPRYYYSCLRVLDEKTFVAVRARKDDVSTDQQQVIIFNYSFGSDSESQFTRTKSIKEITAEILIEHAPDKVLGITHWEDKYVAFLTRSKRLYYYDLQTGRVSLIVVLTGIDPNESSVVNMEALNSKYVAIVFQRNKKSDRFLVIDIKKKTCNIDSSLHDFYGIEKCALSLGRIFIVGTRSGTSYFGEIDYETKKVIKISNYHGRLSLTNFIVTRNLIVIGTIPLVPANNRDRKREKVIFYSLEEKKTLNEVNLDELSPYKEAGHLMKKIACVNDNLVALFFTNPFIKVYSNTLALWDINQGSVVAKNRNPSLKRILGVFEQYLLFTYKILLLAHTGYVDISKPERGYITHKEPGLLGKFENIWENFDPELCCMETLTPLPVFVAYDKKIYPNSLLFFRKISLKIQCLWLVHKKLNEVYNPYIRKQVMDMIFKPQEKNNSRVSVTGEWTGLKQI